jgi:integrase
MLNPDLFYEAFTNKIEALGLRPITSHGLRHTHATQLLRNGVPVHIVSARLGHAKPSITLDTYCHL